MLTSWSLIWLVVTVLFVAGGALNLSQRATGDLAPTDGVLWVQKADGIYAEKVIPGLAGSRQSISPGDKLIAVASGRFPMRSFRRPHVQMYLDAAGVGGPYLPFSKDSYYSANSLYVADLRNIDSLRVSPSIIFRRSSDCSGLAWALCLFKQGSHSPFVLHFAIICLAAFVFHVYRPINIGRILIWPSACLTI